MMDFNGYSPFLRAFGVVVSILPNLVIRDRWLSEQVDPIKNVRQTYLEADSDERIKAAVNRRS